MASVIGGMLQIAFAGSGYLFKMLDKNGYEAEMKRHNKALEELAASNEKFYENEVKQCDRIHRLRQELADTNDDIEKTKLLICLDGYKQYSTIVKHSTENRN